VSLQIQPRLSQPPRLSQTPRLSQPRRLNQAPRLSQLPLLRQQQHPPLPLHRHPRPKMKPRLCTKKQCWPRHCLMT